MEKEKHLAQKFRTAIETAKKERKFAKQTRFLRFPDECCDMTCDLLGYYLYKNKIETHQINCACKADVSRRHVWLETDSGLIIDITGDQFNDKLPLLRPVSPVYVGRETELHKLFCLNKICEENTNFTDEECFYGFGKQPSRRQKDLKDLYEIIERYL